MARKHRRRVTQYPCAYQKLYPTILMMKSAKDRPSGHLAEPLDRPVGRRILVQGQMCSELVVIVDKGRKDAAQMGLAEDADGASPKTTI
jgi:hypothetical protein